jgi:ABC-type bacteriocin/lantibiotic exporter with double-glycine peptidase domain
MKLLNESPLWKNKTFIMTAHRLTTVRLAEEIILISKDEGIKVHSELEKGLKDPNVLAFFKEQFMEISLA